MSEIELRWEGKRGSGKYAMWQLSPVLRVVGVENVRRQVAWATLTQRCGYTEEDASKIALWGEERGRWTSALGFSWSTHRVMGGCADTRCRSMCDLIAESCLPMDTSLPPQQRSLVLALAAHLSTHLSC